MHSWILPKTHVPEIPMTHLILEVVPKSNLLLLDHPSLLDSNDLHLLDFHFLDELLHQPINNTVLAYYQNKLKQTSNLFDKMIIRNLRQ